MDEKCKENDKDKCFNKIVILSKTRCINHLSLITLFPTLTGYIHVNT